MHPWVHPKAAELREREMSPEEFDERLRRALADEERMRELSELVRWFTRRYPTVEERLAYARRKYLDIARSHPLGSIERRGKPPR